MEKRIRIGEQIAKKRNGKGLTIRELGERAGVDWSKISKIENGKANIGIDTLIKLCESLDCEITLNERVND